MGGERRAVPVGVSSAGDEYPALARVLIVEDDASCARVLHRALGMTDSGRFSSVVVETMAGALAALATERFDAALLDLNLPDSQGWDSVSTLLTAAPGLPIVVMTGLGDEELSLRALNAGVQDFLTKPRDITVPEVIGRVLIHAIARERHRALLEDMVARLRAREHELENTVAMLRETRLSLAQADKLETIGRMAAGVAHEVKNPLAILRMGLDYVKKHTPPDQAVPHSVMADMGQAIARADRIIAELLEYGGPQPLRLSSVDLGAVVDDALHLVEATLRQHHVTVEKRFSGGLPQVEADRHRLIQVFVNLLLNAVQAMDGNGRLVLVVDECDLEAFSRRSSRERVAEVGDPSARVVFAEVLDSGPGIAPEHLKKLFEPFFTTKRVGLGTGLGLSVSRMIMDMHGGGLTIENRPEGGAVARVFFLV